MNEHRVDRRQAPAGCADADRWQSIFDAIGEGRSLGERERLLSFEQVELLEQHRFGAACSGPSVPARRFATIPVCHGRQIGFSDTGQVNRGKMGC